MFGVEPTTLRTLAYVPAPIGSGSSTRPQGRGGGQRSVGATSSLGLRFERMFGKLRAIRDAGPHLVVRRREGRDIGYSSMRARQATTYPEDPELTFEAASSGRVQTSA